MLPRLKVHDDLALGGQDYTGWAIRKNSPQLQAVLNDFYVNYVKKQGVVEYRLAQYMKKFRQIRNNAGDAEQQRFQQTLALFQKYGTQYGFDPLMLAAQGFQESQLDQQARSHVGAIGIMQLMPSTAKWVARQNGRRDFRAAELDLPSVNAQFGTFYLRYVLDRLDNLPVVATAAYNAGPGRAQTWRGAAPLEGAIYAETIPFNETRDYVKKVLANAMFYQAQLGLPYVALKERLGLVSPDERNGTASPPPADRSSETQ